MGGEFLSIVTIAKRKWCTLLVLPLWFTIGIFAAEPPLNFSFTTQVLPEGFDRGTSYSHQKAFYFSIPLAEGNYNVTATLGDPKEACVTTVKAETRRLMLEHIRTVPGQTVARTFTVNIRNLRVPPPPQNAPGGDRVRINDREQGALHWDDKLTLEIGDTHPCLAALSVEKAEVPTIFLAGDSTVTDQPGETYASWGQMLPRFLKPGVGVANHAESGETLKSFLSGLRLDKILSQMKKGDYLFIQFGHNDMKANWPQTYAEAFTTYRQYLKVYIAEARRLGATPVLVTPVQRRDFDANGKARNTLGDYPEAVRQTAKEEHTALIDLNGMSMTFYEALGPARAPLAFAAQGRDATHHSPYGAYEIAKCIVEGIKSNHLDLARFVLEDAPPFDPSHPDPPETWSFPASPSGGPVRPPRGN